MSSQVAAGGSKHRLKREELVMAVLSLLSDEFERSDVESIWEVSLQVATIRQHLSERHGTSYSSDHWLHTQLRRYEDELGVPLFERRKPAEGSGETALALYAPMVDFYQKQHLYVTEKIKIANGTYDFITQRAQLLGPDRPCNVLLGAGSTVYHLATIFANKSHTGPNRYRLYTHNAGFIQTLLNSNVNYERLSLFTLGGELEPVTRTILGTRLDELGGAELDVVVQGTSCVCDGRLYVESDRERSVKSAILHDCGGIKVLVCTKHEFSREPLADTEAYGALQDYDYIVVPHSPVRDQECKLKHYEEVFREHKRYLDAQVLNWNYAIFRVV